MSTPTASAKPRRWRRRFLKLTIVGGTALICLLVLEVVVRLAFPLYDPNRQVIFQVNTDGVTLGVPSQTFRQRTAKGDWDISVSFNQYGFRDSHDLKQASSNDLFVAGDSFPLGWGVEAPQRFSNLLEKELGRPVYNIAAPDDIRGYIATVKFAERLGAKIQHMVIALSMETDVWDYTNPESTHARYQRDLNRGKRRAFFNWIKTHSALWMCASHTIQSTRPGRELFEKLGIARNVEALTHKNEYSPKILAATRDELLKLATNYHSVTLVIPTRGLWHGQNSAKEKQIHEELMVLLRDAGLHVVDMRLVFETSGNPLQFYFASDSHWNAAGHKAAAEELMRYFRSQSDWPMAPHDHVSP
jgi:hypothetical protein